MLGLTQLEERLIWIAALVITIIGFAWHERHLGAEKCIEADERATAAQEAHNVAVLAQGTTTVYQEASDYHEAVTAPIARPVHLRVCQPSATSPVPNAAPAGPVGNGAASLPGSGDAAPVQSDVGPELQAVGRDADAQINQLQDYVRRVCLVR
jgi:hypothetical protein